MHKEIKATEQKLHNEIQTVEKNLHKEIKATEQKLHNEIQTVERNLHKEIKATEQKLHNEIQTVEKNLHEEIKATEQKLHEETREVNARLAAFQIEMSQKAQTLFDADQTRKEKLEDYDERIQNISSQLFEHSVRIKNLEHVAVNLIQKENSEYLRIYIMYF